MNKPQAPGTAEDGAGGRSGDTTGVWYWSWCIHVRQDLWDIGGERKERRWCIGNVNFKMAENGNGVIGPRDTGGKSCCRWELTFKKTHWFERVKELLNK